MGTALNDETYLTLIRQRTAMVNERSERLRLIVSIMILIELN